MRRKPIPPPDVSDYSILLCPQNELDLEHTLASGQAFRWRRDGDGWWSAVVGGDQPILMRCWQDREQIYYQSLPKQNDLGALRSYFQLEVDLPALARQWEAAAGREIADALEHFAGLRVTLQDPVECLISFLCSAVAPIYRIRRGIDALCRTLGARLGEAGGRDQHDFPSLENMAATPREMYDKMGLGFRGGNVRETAREVLAQGGRSYIIGLRDATYLDAKTALMALPGVGAKIADCVCLFSFGMHQAVPLDVHMIRVAKRLFPQARTLKTLTPRAYTEIGDLFRDRFGPHAGWAQQYLFYNELRRTGAWDEEMGMHRPATRRLSKP